MSNKSVGAAFEKKVQALMEDMGFAIERANPKLMYVGPGKMISKAHDLYGCIDLLGIHYSKKVYFVQCTTGDAAVRRHKIDSHTEWNFEHSRVILIKRMPNKRDWKMYELHDYEKKWTESIFSKDQREEIFNDEIHEQVSLT